MAEIKKTLTEWIEEEVRLSKLRRQLAEFEKSKARPMASLRAATPKAFTPPKPDLRPPAELPENPGLEDIAKQLGVSVEELRQASGSMSLERLMQLLDVETPAELVESLNLIISNGPKALNRRDRLRVGVARARLAGRRVGQLLKLEKAKAARAEALKRHHAWAKARS